MGAVIVVLTRTPSLDYCLGSHYISAGFFADHLKPLESEESDLDVVDMRGVGVVFID